MKEYKLGKKEIEAVSALPYGARYAYFIKKVADWKLIWTLESPDGFVLLGSRDGRERVPVWPHSEFARRLAVDKWSDAKATSIPLDAWLDLWTPGLTRDNRLVAVLPNTSLDATSIEAQKLAADIREELGRLI